MKPKSTGLLGFLEDSALTFSQRILSFVLGLIVSVILARVLGRSGVGIVTLTLLFPTMIVTFVNFGVPSATVYLLGSRKYTISEVLFNNLVLSFFQSILGFIGALLILLLFKDLFFSNVANRYLYWMLIVIPVNLTNMNLRVIF
ncbi:MAG: hypothetical protein DSY55_01575, partial [Clostridia bacterium]